MPNPRRAIKYTGPILTDRARVGILEEKIDKLLGVVADLAASNRALAQQVVELRPLTERENLERYFKSQMSAQELDAELARLAKLAEGTDWEAYEKEAYDWRSFATAPPAFRIGSAS